VTRRTKITRSSGASECRIGFGEGWRPRWPQGSGKQDTSVYSCPGFPLWLLALPFASSRTSAADADHSSYLTFRQQVALPGVSLGAGTYIFEVPESNTSWDVVRVSKRG
jgi:hypothetical protein